MCTDGDEWHPVRKEWTMRHARPGTNTKWGREGVVGASGPASFALMSAETVLVFLGGQNRLIARLHSCHSETFIPSGGTARGSVTHHRLSRKYVTEGNVLQTGGRRELKKEKKNWWRVCFWSQESQTRLLLTVGYRCVVLESAELILRIIHIYDTFCKQRVDKLKVSEILHRIKDHFKSGPNSQRTG